MQMLTELISNSQTHNKFCMEALIVKFNPLLIRYARKLNYEDAYQDLVIFFIDLILRMDIRKLHIDNDAAIISYFQTCVQNQYVFLLRKLIVQKRELYFTDMVEEQIYKTEKMLATYDEANMLMEWNLRKILNAREYNVISLIYCGGFSAAELAQKYGTTRQAINQQKMRAINKIRRSMQINK